MFFEGHREFINESMGVDFVEDDGTLVDSVDLSDKNISIYRGLFFCTKFRKHFTSLFISSSLLYRNSIKFDDYIPGVRGIFVRTNFNKTNILIKTCKCELKTSLY